MFSLDSPPKSQTLKLFIMMLLEFFIWGAWLPKIFGYLPAVGFDGNQTLAILLAFPVAAVLGMFFSNQMADRYFAAEKFLAFSHLISGLAILGLGFLPIDDAGKAAFWPFFALMVVHCVLYVPTMSITNSIAFANMKDPVKEFGIVRMGGTIGWILAAWPFIFLLANWAEVNQAIATAKEAGESLSFTGWLGAVFGSKLTGAELISGTRWTFIVAGVASLALAAYSLTLPHTPPKQGEPGDSLALIKAFGILKNPVVMILWIVTLIDSFVHNTYFFHTDSFLGSSTVGIASNWTQAVMSIGQVAEILTMFILGWTLHKLGWKATMIIGVLGHTLRFLVYAFLPEHKELMITVQIIHGICYAFYFATVYIYIDKCFPSDIRTSAQGLFNLMIFGLGDIVCKIFWIYIGNPMFIKDNVTDWRGIFLVPAGLSALAAFILLMAFHPKESAADVDVGH
ncbi:MAG: MFS transporter [Pirellulales bacterium]